MNALQEVRPKKSVKLSNEQLKIVRDTFNSSSTKIEAAIKLGISREVLDRILIYGSCHEKTFVKLFGQEALTAAISITE